MIISSASCTAISLLKVVSNQRYRPASSSNGDNSDSDSDEEDRGERDEGTGSRHGMTMEVVRVGTVLEEQCCMW